MLQPVKEESFTLESNLPYVLVFTRRVTSATGTPDSVSFNIPTLCSSRNRLFLMVLLLPWLFYPEELHFRLTKSRRANQWLFHSYCAKRNSFPGQHTVTLQIGRLLQHLRPSEVLEQNWRVLGRFLGLWFGSAFFIIPSFGLILPARTSGRMDCRSA